MSELTIELDDFVWYVDEALESMRSILSGLGDELANRRPALPGANSAYVIVTHCLGVMEDWGGGSIAGRSFQRDRAAEFVATGRVTDLLDRLTVGRDQLVRDLASIDPSAPPRQEPAPGDVGRPLARSQAGVALHIYEELAQHLGQLQLTRDIVTDGVRPTSVGG
jgi:hypothetical protein